MPHTVRTSLTTWVFQKKLNDLSSAGNEAMRLSRKQFWDGAGSGGPTIGIGTPRLRVLIAQSVTALCRANGRVGRDPHCCKRFPRLPCSSWFVLLPFDLLSTRTFFVQANDLCVR
jgi:hypothetical protein